MPSQDDPQHDDRTELDAQIDTGEGSDALHADEKGANTVTDVKGSARDAVERVVDGWRTHFSPEELEKFGELRRAFEQGYSNGVYGGINRSAAASIRDAFRMLAHKGVSIDWMEDVLGMKMGVLRLRLGNFNKRLPEEEKISFATAFERESLPKVQELLKEKSALSKRIQQDDYRRLVELWVRISRCIGASQDVPREIREEMGLQIYRTKKIGDEFIGISTDDLWPKDLRPKLQAPAVDTPHSLSIKEPVITRAVAEESSPDVPRVLDRSQDKPSMVSMSPNLLSRLIAEVGVIDPAALTPALRQQLAHARGQIDLLLGHAAVPMTPAQPLDPNRVVRVDMGDRSMLLPEEIVRHGGKITVTEVVIAPATQPE